MILICFTKTVPKDGEQVNVYLTVGEYTSPDMAKQDLIMQQIRLRDIHYILSLTLPSDGDEQFESITDVVFFELRQIRTPERVRYELHQYQSEAQKQNFMRKYNASTAPNNP